MKRSGLSGLMLILCAAVFMVAASPGQCAIKVGVGETTINPPIGLPMSGYARQQNSDGIHDDLHARSLVIEGDNGTAMVFMTLAIINISRNHFDQIRGEVNRQTGIPVQNILISCTHTHSGPAVPNSDHPYTKLLIDRSVESAVTAWKNRVPGRVGFGTSVARELGKNDRRMQYGGMHVDPEVGIIKIENTRGKLLGIAFNYGCHPSTLDLHSFKFTEDWPYYSIKGIKEKVGKDVWVAFYQSAQGDSKVGYTAELSAVGAEMNIRTFEYAEYKGNMMVDSVMKVLDSIKTSDNLDVAVTEKSFDMPAREGYRLTEAEAQKQADAAKAAMEMAEKQPNVYGKRVIDALRVENYIAGLRLSAAKRFNVPNRPKTIKILQQAVRIGDTVFVTFPNEVFTEIGLKVKTQSPLENTFVIGIAGAMGGYLPTAEEHKEEGYAALISPFSPRAEQALIDSSLELIATVMKPDLKSKRKE
ncbi:MAG: neutral/alkaline non-lysosomal ceramidase N-terminal domain-containing protein [Candidatus Latescibacterota bacterium]